MEGLRVNIGELDTLVTLQTYTQTTGDRGQKTFAFTDHSKVWAKVEGNIDEASTDNNLESQESLRITIYKVTGLSTKWRVVIKDKSFEIEGIDPISRFSPLCIVTLSALD